MSDLNPATRRDIHAAVRKYGDRWWLLIPWTLWRGISLGVLDLWRSRVFWFGVGVIVGLRLALFVYTVTHHG